MVFNVDASSLVPNLTNGITINNFIGRDHDNLISILSLNNFEDNDDNFDNDAYSNNSNDDEVSTTVSRKQRRSSRRSRPTRRSTNDESFLSILQNTKQLGAAFIGVGFMMSLLGMILLFEKNLLRLGNMFLVSGIVLLIGPTHVLGFFMKQSRIQATVITLLGILLVFYGKPRIGILIEIFGLLNLFGNMFPVLYAIARRMPIIGDVLSVFDSQGDSANSAGLERDTKKDRKYSSRYDVDDSSQF